MVPVIVDMRWHIFCGFDCTYLLISVVNMISFCFLSIYIYVLWRTVDWRFFHILKLFALWQFYSSSSYSWYCNPLWCMWLTSISCSSDDCFLGCIKTFKLYKVYLIHFFLLTLVLVSCVRNSCQIQYLDIFLLCYPLYVLSFVSSI